MDYELIRSARKTLAIEIGRGGGVTVRAPLRCPRREIERFLASRAGWIESRSARQRQRMEAHPEPDEAGREKLISRAKAELPPKVERYARIMGLRPEGVTITGAKTRFGSCSCKNRLCFSWRLMQYPDEAVDYVVVHELAHIVHKNHGPEFYALIASVLPDHARRRALLRM